MTRRLFLLVILVLILAACSPTAATPTAVPTIADTFDTMTPAATETTVPATAEDTATVEVAPSITVTATGTETPAPAKSAATQTITSTVAATDTGATATPDGRAPTATETLSDMLKTRIVFYLILPQKGHTDACGDITLVPIITKRYRTGDRLADVQIALNMLMGMHIQRYGVYYNALWNTDLSIASTKYNPENDEMSIDFTGYIPFGDLTTCDKHGIREEIWKTFYNYGIAQKIFTFNGHFLIDQLNRK